MGIVTVNSDSQLSHQAPWGSFKLSGIRRRYGEIGLAPLFEYKTVWVRQISSSYVRPFYLVNHAVDLIY